MTKLGIISDTHGHLLDTQRAIDIFWLHGVSVVIHCGDIGGVDIVRLFKKVETHFVLGNCDGNVEALRRAATETGNTLHGEFGSIELDGKKIAFLHGHDNDRFEKELDSGRWDLICYGHTHFASFEKHGDTLLLNPGAFQKVMWPQIAMMTFPEMTIECFRVTLG